MAMQCVIVDAHLCGWSSSTHSTARVRSVFCLFVMADAAVVGAAAADVPEVGGIAPTLALFVKTFDDDEDPEYVTICLCAVVDM